MENWGLIEIVWTLVAVFGAYFSVRNTKDGLSDLKAAKLMPTNLVEVAMIKVTAFGLARNAICLLIAQLFFAFVGILSGFAPATPSSSPLMPLGGLLFILAVSVLSLISVSDHNDRVRMIQLGKLREATGNGEL